MATTSNKKNPKQEALIKFIAPDAFKRKYLPRINAENVSEVVLVAKHPERFEAYVNHFTTAYLNHSGIHINKEEKAFLINPHHGPTTEQILKNFALPNLSPKNAQELADYCIDEGINTTTLLARFIKENDNQFSHSSVLLSDLTHWLARLLQGKPLELSEFDLYLAFYSALPLNGFTGRLRELANLKIFRWHESEYDIYQYLRDTSKSKGEFVGAIRCGHSLHVRRVRTSNQFTYLYVDGSTGEEGKLQLSWNPEALEYKLEGANDPLPVPLQNLNMLDKAARSYTANSDKVRPIIEALPVVDPTPYHLMEFDDYAKDEDMESILTHFVTEERDEPQLAAVGSSELQAANIKPYRGTAADAVQKLSSKK